MYQAWCRPPAAIALFAFSVPLLPSWIMFVDRPFLHDEVDMLEDANIDQRITLDGDDIRGFSGADGAEQFGVAYEIRGVHRGRLNGLHGGHPVLDHIGELPRIDAVRADSGIRAEGHLHAGTHCFGEIAALDLAEILVVLEEIRRRIGRGL